MFCGSGSRSIFSVKTSSAQYFSSVNLQICSDFSLILPACGPWWAVPSCSPEKRCFVSGPRCRVPPHIPALHSEHKRAFSGRRYTWPATQPEDAAVLSWPAWWGPVVCNSLACERPNNKRLNSFGSGFRLPLWMYLTHCWICGFWCQLSNRKREKPKEREKQRFKSDSSVC